MLVLGIELTLELTLYHFYMARARLDKRHVRKLNQVGRGKTYSLTVPIGMIRKLKWRQGQKVVFELNERKKELKVKDWKKSGIRDPVI